MKYLFIKQLRDFKKGIFLNISVFIITFLGLFLFSGLNSVGRNIKAGIEDFYDNQNLADYTVTCNITLESLGEVRKELRADGAVTYDAVSLKIGDNNRNIIVSLFPYNDFVVNTPNISQGSMPKDYFDCLIDSAFAKANGIEPGMPLTIKLQGGTHEVRISGLAEFPDHLYKGTTIPQIEETGILKLYVDKELFSDLTQDIRLNTLYICSELSEKNLRNRLEELTGDDFSTARVLDRSQNISVVRVSSDIELITSLMKILPSVCLIALCLILYVNTSKRIEDARYNIGVMTANGISKFGIALSYILPYFIWVLLGGILGAIFGVVFLPKAYIALLTKFYTLPTLPSFKNAISVILPLIILIAVTLISLIIAIIGTMMQTPVNLMRGKSQRSVKILRGTKLPVVYKLSFRNFISYKKKSVFTVISATLCLGLLFTAFLLDNSVSNLQDTVYGKYYNFDTTLSWNLGDGLDYGEIESDIKDSDLFDDILFCVEFPADVLNEKGEVYVNNVIVSIIDGDAPCYNLYDKDGKITYSDAGVYIPESYGDLKSIGLRIYADEPRDLTELPIAGSYTDMGVFGIIIPLSAIEKNNSVLYELLMSNTDLFTEIFTTKKDGVTENSIREFVDDLSDKYSAAFLYEQHSVDSQRFKQLFAVLNVTEILLFIVCGAMMILLILNISCLSIADRIKDYIVFKAMGLSANKINFLNSLENYFSIIIAFILSIPTGILITNAIIKVVTHITGVVVYLHLYVLSAVILLLGAGLFTAISNIFINKKISTTNIADTLKLKE